jgi:hypothetical protein
MSWNIGFINEFIAVILEAIIMIFTYYVILDRAYFFIENKFKTVLFIISYSLVSMWSTFNIPPMYHTLVITSFSIIILSTITSIKFKKSLITILICIIYFALIEVSTVAIFTLISGNNYFDSHILKSNLVIITYIAKFIEWLIIFLLYKFYKMPIKINAEKREENIAGYWVLGMFVMALFILAGIISKEKALVYQVVLMVFFYVFVILGIIDYRSKLELIKIKNNYHLKQEYINNLEAIVDIIRKEKHDFANHINTVYAMCIMNREDSLDRIKDYLKKTTNNLQESYRFYDTGNSYVDGLIAVKSNYAFENSIYLDVDFETPLSAILIRDNDLIGVIGNILDNAMHAVSTGDKEGKKIVSVYGYLENNKYFLSIANNGPMVPKEIVNKIFKKGFSTKKQNKGEHGFGLYIVNDIVKKNGGQILFSSFQEETEFLIEFKVKEDYYEESCHSTYQCDI